MATHEAARVDRLRGLYLIVNEGAGDPVALARAGMDGGIRIVQYRAKGGIVADRLRALRALTAQHGALLILNDDAPAALAFGCDGVHLGPDDAGFDRIAAVRETLGDRLIGISAGTLAEARAAAGADYLGVGAVFATPSKADAGEPIGLDGLRAIARATPLPVAAIGGITAADLAAVRAAGAAMAAVISALAGDPDPNAAALRLGRAWEAAG